jgi:threonine dehydratase
MRLVSIDDVHRAAHAVGDVAIRTPLLACEWAEGRLWLKPENLQLTGSFKIRGAYNAIAALDPDRRRAGVITYSSGNHGQAVAYAARAFEAPCAVVMNDDAPAVKVEAVARLGAEVVPVPLAERVAVAEGLALDRGYALVPPFAHPDVIAGQGTVGLEIMAGGPTPDVVLVPVGGGGLASGVATAVKAVRPSTAVIGVEPELAADAAESLSSGVLTTWPAARTSRTIADGLRPTGLSELTFAHLHERLDGIVTVTDDQIRAAVARLAREAHLVAEPSGAVAVAAYLFQRDQLPDGPTVAVISGGNIDPRLLADVLTADPM